jgi:MoaA/NifB/PqqE/SkfB family radical SAM enzyme
MDLYRMDGSKLLWEMDRVHEHFRDNKRVYPLHIDMGASNFCEARCVYCYAIHQKMTGKMLSKDILFDLFRDAPRLGIKSITITGDGEPNLNPNIFEAVKIGKENGLDIGYATNGIALNHLKTKTLLENCVWVRFNLSASDRETYKKVHGIDAWEKVKLNIIETVKTKKKIKSPCTIGTQMVLIPQVFDQIYKTSIFSLESGVDYFVIKQYANPGCAGMTQFDFDLYDSMVAELHKAEQLSNEVTKIIPKYVHIGSKGQRDYDHCLDLPLLLQISGTGKCYPCSFLFRNEEFCYGDLNKQSLKDILDSERYWAIIKRMRYDFDVKKSCVGECRHSACNRFLTDYLNPPAHITFI